jgi:hypothetical protein
MRMPTRNASGTGKPGWWVKISPSSNADRPSTDPTERSTLRVTITSVSPTESSAMIDAPVRICWTLAVLAKECLSALVAKNTSRTRAPMLSSRVRDSVSAIRWPRAAGAWLGGVSTVTVMPPPGWPARSRLA